jgi:hypothetical protein
MLIRVILLSLLRCNTNTTATVQILNDLINGQYQIIINTGILYLNDNKAKK